MIDRNSIEHFVEERDGLIENFEFNSSENYSIKFRLKTDQNTREQYNKICSEFIDQFSNFTCTNWIVYKSFPSIKRFLFRKMYTCHLSSFNKKSTVDDNSGRNRNCKAMIDFHIKKINKDTIRNDKLLLEGYNVLVSVRFKHSHRVYVADALSVLKCSSETEETFKKYFDSGMTPSAAKSYNEMKILDSFENTGVDGVEMLANSQINPSEKHIFYMYDKWRSQKYSEHRESNLPEIMEETAKKLNNSNGLILFEQNPRIIVIVTSIMKRIFLSPACENTIFVETIPACDQTSFAITLVFTSTKIGGLPLACAIHTEQDESSYSMVFAVIKKAIERNDECKKFEPDIIMTDDSKAERNALKPIFPNARLLLCAFHVCRAFWRWLCAEANKIDIVKRQSIMKQFRNVLFSTKPGDALRLYTLLVNDEYVKTIPSLLHHLATLWQRRLEWCVFERIDPLTRGMDTHNITEASIRILRDIVLQRCEVSNTCALVDFITTILDNYFQKSIIAYANTSNTKNVEYAKFTNAIKNIEHIFKLNDFEYSVLSQSNPNTFYTVRADLAVCDCDAGTSGTFCEHLCAIEQKFGTVFPNSPQLSANDRLSLAKIATGDEINEEFYLNMSLDKDLLVPETQITLEDPLASTSSCLEQNTSVEFSHRYKSAIENLKVAVDRFTVLFENNATVHNMKALNKFTRMLNKINTIEQGHNFIIKRMGSRRLARNIAIHSTAVSRQKKKGMKKTRTRNVRSSKYQ